MIPEPKKPSLRLVLTSEFGDVTDITKDLSGAGMEDIFWAIRDALAGCGFNHDTIDQWFPEE